MPPTRSRNKLLVRTRPLSSVLQRRYLSFSRTLSILYLLLQYIGRVLSEMLNIAKLSSNMAPVWVSLSLSLSLSRHSAAS